MQFIFYVGHSFLITASLFFNWVILLWGSNLSTHIKFLWEPTFLSMSLSMSVLLSQISASGSAKATFRVEEMVFPDVLKASFLSVSQLPEAKSCAEAAQPRSHLRRNSDIIQSDWLKLQNTICNLPKFAKTKFLDPHKNFLDLCTHIMHVTQMF